MRADKAYIAGIGTTSVLVASALLLLAVVSTFVAFRGWPGTDVTDDIGSLIVGQPQRPLAVGDGPARIAAEAAPAAGAVAETAAPGTPAAEASAGAAPAPPARTRQVRAVVPPRDVSFRGEARLQQGTGFGAPGDLDDRGSPVSLLPQTPVSAEVERVTSGLGSATEGLTDGLGQTVGGLSPPLGEAVVDTGHLLAELLRALGQTRR